MKTSNDYITIYKKQLEKGDLQKAYTILVKYVLTLKSQLSKTLNNKFSFGNVSQGYMDYTYFPFFDVFLRERKLRLGIVLNHQELRFELWLMGQNSEIKRQYWDIFKTTKWIKNPKKQHKYAALDIVLVETPDFNNLDLLTKKLEKETIRYAEEVLDCLKKLEK